MYPVTIGLMIPGMVPIVLEMPIRIAAYWKVKKNSFSICLIELYKMLFQWQLFKQQEMSKFSVRNDFGLCLKGKGFV